ncbi:MAG: hypothetical protein KA715_03800 [Xanthomonadaceae bacterium]|nr:hypothetical protein [Xanthomonadaceae bacterium]
MTRLTDNIPAQTGWIHELVRSEVHPEAEKLLGLTSSFDPASLIEENTIQFLSQLQEEFQSYSKLFNGYSENGIKFQDIKIYSLAGSPADFMMFRSQVKLVVSNSTAGVISLSFSRHIRSTMNVNGQGSQDHSVSNVSMNKGQELRAQIGPFHEVFWTYEGERVTAAQVTKFFFIEFVRATRDSRKVRGSNQVLLEQIKTLLQEKGLDL